ncbi:DUF1932 domain-containing protein [Xanthobacter sediminis]|uniref:DUF1932 domain-containing protein n=1 Tax=Xanthobacter sediminis TaxID=3119926 RepID=UPI003729C8F8
MASSGENPDLGLAFVGFGEAASHIASGLRGAGVGGMSAYDVAIEGGPRRPLLEERAAAAGVRLLASPAGLAGACHVLALVQPAASVDAARMAAPHLAAGALYVDLSSAAPQAKRESAAIVEACGARFVDGAIIGSAPTSGHRVPILASGDGAEAFRMRFGALGMDITPVAGGIGAAAGIKLVRSILAKGLEALYVEALLVAERAGVTDAVLDTFCAFLDARPARDTAAMLLKSHVVHAARRADEVRMSRDLARAAGLSPLMTEAIIAVMEQTAATDVATALGGRQPPTLGDALHALDAALAPPSHAASATGAA